MILSKYDDIYIEFHFSLPSSILLQTVTQRYLPEK